MARGRAGAGASIDEQGFTAFFAETLGAELETEWRDLDKRVHDDGLRPLYDEYRSIWPHLVRAEKG